MSASSDVYAFGIILMQLLTGLSVSPGRVEEALETGGLAAILDTSAGSWPVKDAEKVIKRSLILGREQPNASSRFDSIRFDSGKN